jgi:two-component system chemotaxis sensor kinase CheA
VDHGIEKPEIRQQRGKPEEGQILLRAYHEGGQVNIEISDDGGGIDTERLKQKAVEVGIISADQAARMGEREAIGLIFHAGFSTAEKVTNVSGRGVGMDVVKTNMEKIGGTFDVQSTYGQGTTLKIKIPLTLAIIPALVVTQGPDRYAIPQVSLLELVRLEGDAARSKIEDIRGAPVYRLRGRLLPLVFLNRELKLGADDSTNDERDIVNIVVLQADDRQFGLVVDGVSDTAEIVVKPLGKLLKGISVFAGATIMGDGRVSLILDVLGLAQRASVVSEIRDRSLADKSVEHEARDEKNHQTLLLFRTPDDGRMALPLSMVARLEEFQRSAIERAGNQEMVQYRGHILPLIHISHVLPERRQAPRSEEHQDLSDKIHVVVYSTGERSVGLVVDRIIDIVEENLAIERAAARDCVVGTLVIQGKVTEFLDVEAVIRAGIPTFDQQAA